MVRVADEFQRDERYHLILLDCGFAVIDDFPPHQVTNVGVREQAAVSLAAGMASEGMKPVIYSIASFIVFRAFEQIRLDVVATNLPVKIIGYGSGNRFHRLGRSHVTDGLDLDILDQVGLEFYDASYPTHTDGWLIHDGPAYLRVP